MYQGEHLNLNNPSSNRVRFKPKQSKLVTFVISNSGGLLKTESQANVFLTVLAIIAIIISIILRPGQNEKIDSKYIFDPTAPVIEPLKQ